MPRSPASSTRPVRSTLVYGADETGASALVTGMALRDHGSFRWADCARSVEGEPPAHRLFARGQHPPEVREVTEEILEPARVDDSVVRQLLAPEGAEEDRRLSALLRLPELFQKLGSEAAAPRTSVAIVLANVDRLPARTQDGLLGQPAFHDLLRRAGLALYSTAAGRPSAGLIGAYEAVYRLELPAAGSWVDGVVHAEKPRAGEGTRPARSVRDTWTKFDLDPTLLASR